MDAYLIRVIGAFTSPFICSPKGPSSINVDKLAYAFVGSVIAPKPVMADAPAIGKIGSTSRLVSFIFSLLES
jgi:hypothetical protein